MPKWHRTKAATSLGIMGYLPPLFEVYSMPRTSGKLSSEFKIRSSVEASEQYSLWKQMHQPITIFVKHFLLSPPKNSGRPESLFFFQNTLCSSIFMYSKNHINRQISSRSVELPLRKFFISQSRVRSLIISQFDFANILK